jgi:uncharacterized membrane protein
MADNVTWLVHFVRFIGRVWAQDLAWNSATPFSTARDIAIPALVLICLLGVRIKEWRMPQAKETIRAVLTTVVVILALLGTAFGVRPQSETQKLGTVLH